MAFSTRRTCAGARTSAFVAEARKAYGITVPIALAYSNGTNIATAMMLL